MPALIQLALLVVLTAGMGYWVWLWARKPAPFRAGTWLWCGLAGFSLALLLQQALVYVDVPLRKTALLAGLAAAAGFVLLAFRVWRARRKVTWRQWRGWSTRRASWGSEATGFSGMRRSITSIT